MAETTDDPTTPEDDIPAPWAPPAPDLGRPPQVAVPPPPPPPVPARPSPDDGPTAPPDADEWRGDGMPTRAELRAALGPPPTDEAGYPRFGPGSLAPLGRRIWARLFDTALIVIPFLVLVYLVWTTVKPDGEVIIETIPFWAVGGIRLVSIVYETITVAWFGRTLGKWIFGLRVEDAFGNRPALHRAAIRITIPDALTLAPLFGGALAVLGYLTAPRDPQGRHLYDHAAGTVVVSAR